MQNIYIDIVATFDALPFRQGRVPTPCHFDKAECQRLAISTRQSASQCWIRFPQGRVPVLCQFVSMTKPVHESELGKAFWNNVRVENICCRLFETSDGEGPPEGALQMGPYVRPHNPLESSMTRTGRVCLQFHVKGSPESSVLQLKVGWTYVHHGQNRDSMLGKIMEPEVVQILALLKQLSIPSSERQSAEKLKCVKIAEDALSLLQGRVPNEKNPTDQVHIIVKLHRVKTREEKEQGWPDGNASDAVFLKGRRWTKYRRTFPQFLAFDEFALMTHHKTSGNLFPVTRRSVMVTEAKGDGTPLGKFISDRLANISRFSSEKETMQLVFKAFKFILQVQMHHLETEGAFLADLHENNITVMSDGNGGPLDVQFAFVDASGLLTVKGPQRARKDHIKAHLWCFLSIWSIVRVDKGHRNHLSAYAAQVWVKMQKTADEFSRNFRRDAGWMPEQILRGLQRDVDDIQQKFLDEHARSVQAGNAGSHLQTVSQRVCVGGCLESSLNSSVGPRQSASRPGRRQSATKTRQSAVSSRHSSSPGSGATKSQAQACSSC